MLRPFLVSVLLSLVFLPGNLGNAAHIPGAEFEGLGTFIGQGDMPCCGGFDCVVATTALLGQHADESEVLIGETLLTVPSAWVHQAPGPTGLWCFVYNPQTDTLYIDAEGRQRALPPTAPTRANTRCVFVYGNG